MISKIGRDTESDKYRLETSSLIDVGFLLLIYFLVTSTLDPREGDLEATIPDDRNHGRLVEERDYEHPHIRVDEIGNVLYGEELVDTDPSNRNLIVLEDRLRTYLEACQVMGEVEFARVNLDVDDSVPGQRLIDVMNCLTKVGIRNVMFEETWFSEK